MGLDLYHAIPSVTSAENLDYFTLEELRERPDFIERYKHLITEADKFFVILIFPTDYMKCLYLSHHPLSQDEAVLVGEMNELGNEIHKLEREYNLDKASEEILRPTDITLSQQYDLVLTYYTLNYRCVEGRKVIYWAEKGYQRKGMNGYFYNDFEDGKLYFDKATVIKASQYLTSSNIYGKELQMHFQKNFIDNFIEGESIFFGSW